MVDGTLHYLFSFSSHREREVRASHKSDTNLPVMLTDGRGRTPFCKSGKYIDSRRLSTRNEWQMISFCTVHTIVRHLGPSSHRFWSGLRSRSRYYVRSDLFLLLANPHRVRAYFVPISFPFSRQFFPWLSSMQIGEHGRFRGPSGLSLSP